MLQYYECIYLMAIGDYSIRLKKEIYVWNEEVNS